MRSYVNVALLLCACVALSSAQYEQFGFGFNDGYFANSIDNAGLNVQAAGARDPRANTGPVVFPQSPPGDPSQTSGVIVGASGFGFVPPGSQGPAVPRFFYPGFYYRR